MKKIFFILIFLSLKTFAQIFPANDINFFLNKDVTPKLNGLKEYKNFYSKFNKNSNTFNKEDKLFPVGPKYNLSSDTTKLNNQIFKIVNVYPVNDEFNSKILFCLELQNETLGTVFYIYNSKREFEFELSFTDYTQISDEYFCNRIIKRVDKFEDKNIYNTPIVDDIEFIKYEEKGLNSYVLYLKYYINYSGHNPVVDAKGVNILLSNNTKMNFPNQDIDVEATEKGFVYSAFIMLTNKQFTELKNNEISDYKLYAYSKTISRDNKLIIKRYLNCL